MRRRDLLLLASAALLSPFGVDAQQERARVIGYLTGATGSPEDLFGVLQTRALVSGLRELGWVDGRNITIDHRFSGSGRERIRATAKELVAAKPDVIFSVGGLSLAALLAETRTIPIVFTIVDDPVGIGFVANLAQPGGNATGIAVGEAPIAGKWLDLLKEIAPQTTRVMVIMAAGSQPQQVMRDAVAAAAPRLGVRLITAAVHDMAEYEQEIVSFGGEPGGGLVVLSNPIVSSNHQRIHALAAQYRLPAVYSYPIYAQSGGLLSYGPDPFVLVHDATQYIDKILRGARPGDLPVEQPTRFLLVVNLKTAKALGLTVPRSLLARADEVIE
jgi:putative ABC transport system substrate-binding protein